MTYDAAIIGGGVSGLATALALKSAGYSVVVLERQVRPGGNAISERLPGGFLMEHGPSTMPNGAPAATDLSAMLDLDRQRRDLGSGVRRRYLARDNELSGISAHPLGLLSSGYLSLTGRARLLAEMVIPRGGAGLGADETIAQFCTRRFGAEITERIFEPLVGGIYAGLASELSVTSLFPRLVAFERQHGSVTRGVLTNMLSGTRMPGRRLFSWQDGIGTLPKALTGVLGAAVRSGVAVRDVGRTAEGFRVDLGPDGRLDARAVVLATQPHVSAQLIEGLDPDAAEAAGSIPAPPLAVVYLGMERRQVDHPLDGLGFLSAPSEGRLANGAQFCSTMFPGRAPDGSASISVYFGGARAPDLALLPADELIAMAREELRDLVGMTGKPVVARVRHWPRGLPQYGLGHERRIADIEAAGNRHPGLFLVGNYFRGPAVAACLEVAREQADAVSAFLGRHEDRGHSRHRTVMARN